MILVMARQEAVPHERWPKILKGELENNSRKPMDLVKNRHSDSLIKGQLTLSQGKMKKGDDVADDDDDAIRTSVSQDYIALSTYQTGKNEGGERIWTVNMALFVVPDSFVPLASPSCDIQGFR
jgi:hypothetical protein